MTTPKKNQQKKKEKTSRGPGATAAPETPYADTVAEKVPFPIVGIGASAGGLAAFEAFFSAMPTDVEPGMAFVLVQHLAPDHKSILAELIRRYTKMAVFDVEDGMQVMPNCTYIIPPGRDMAFIGGTLQLLEPSAPRGQRLPIDHFFRSLALDQRERAIGIILSGTGSDGTLGIRAIKGEGGMVMVQTPESTEYDGMPQNAIATGLVDYQLKPTEMPGRLIAYVAQTFGRSQRTSSPTPANAANDLKKIFVLLRAGTGHDFSQYKKSTINRRIERRMTVHQLQTIDQYIKYLQKNDHEVQALFRDLLIGVTSFFRDAEAFRALEEQVVPGLFTDKPTGSVIRIWAPGCSTGEEAYSLAILLQEHIETLKQSYQVQIFATDIDIQAIATARAGSYPASIAADITAERLARFFTAESDGSAYRIHKGIRDMLVFSEQNIVRDPPFSKLDLLSCRNLLIYIDGDLQKKLIPLFHYALSPHGVLFLGTSETIGDFDNLFTAIDRKAKLYRRKDEAPGYLRMNLGGFLPPAPQAEVSLPVDDRKTPGAGKLPLRELTERGLLQQVVPVAVLVNRKGDIFYLHGRTGRYLELSPGEAATNILKMARQGLEHPLTSALQKAAVHNKVVHYGGLKVKTNGDFTAVNLSVHPLAPGAGLETPLYLVVFEEAEILARDQELVAAAADGPGDDGIAAGRPIEPAALADMQKLRLELRIKEEYLQSAIEELDTSNEELKSSNEEMQSVNEELQSTNEELETSKEELQSVNEELATVNAELQTKVVDLSQANNDMNNLLAGTGIATVFVDHRQRLLRFTPATSRLINLRAGDQGRPIGHIVTNLIGYDSLVPDVQAVLDTLIPLEIDVRTGENTWYRMRIQPYRTINNVIEGAVITFVDITEVKTSRAEIDKTRALHRLARVVEDANDAVMMQTIDGVIVAWNPAAARIYGWSEAEALSMHINALIPAELRATELVRLGQLSREEILQPYSTKRICKNGTVVAVTIIAGALTDANGKIYAIATTERCEQQKLTP